MSRYVVEVVYADGTKTTIAADARSAVDARQDVIGRLSAQFIEWPPACYPQYLDSHSLDDEDYCPACFDESHARICPNLTRTGAA